MRSACRFARENQEIRPPPFHDGNVHAAPIVAPIFVNTGHQPPRLSSYLRTRTIAGGSINGTVRARPNSRTCCPSGWKISLRRNGASISYHRSPRSTIDPPPPPPLPSPPPPSPFNRVSSTITTSSAATNSRHATRRVHPRDLEGSTFDRAPLQTRSNSSSKRRSPSIRGSSKRERSTTIGDSIDLPLHFAPAEVLGGQSTGRNQA